MSMKNKEEALNDWLTMIRKSWTWNRLTSKEQAKFLTLLENITHRSSHPVIGTYRNRWEVLQVVYEGFLDGCGYDGMNWRE